MQSKKNRLLAKAQSEWMLSSLKEENEGGSSTGPNSSSGGAGVVGSSSSSMRIFAHSSNSNTPPLRMYESYSRNSIAAPPSVFDDKNLITRYNSTVQRQQQQAHDFLEQHILRERERERELEIHVAREREREREYAVAMAAHRQRERELDRERERERELSNFRGAVELHGPPMAHAGEYSNTSVAAAAAINQAAQQAAQAAAVHQHQQAVAAVNHHHSTAGARVEYTIPQAGPGGPPQPADVLTVHRDFYLNQLQQAAQPAVYVTTAAGKLCSYYNS